MSSGLLNTCPFSKLDKGCWERKMSIEVKSQELYDPCPRTLHEEQNSGPMVTLINWKHKGITRGCRARGGRSHIGDTWHTTD